MNLLQQKLLPQKLLPQNLLPQKLLPQKLLPQNLLQRTCQPTKRLGAHCRKQALNLGLALLKFCGKAKSLVQRKIKHKKVLQLGALIEFKRHIGEQHFLQSISLARIITALFEFCVVFPLRSRSTKFIKRSYPENSVVLRSYKVPPRIK